MSLQSATFLMDKVSTYYTLKVFYYLAGSNNGRLFTTNPA